MKKKLYKIFIILLGLYSLVLTIGAIAAPVLSHYGIYNLSAKISMIYLGSCHQNPLRSFSIFGYPFALCCRCLGFYIGCFAGCLFSAADKLKTGKKTVLILTLLFSADIILNFIFSFDTGNIARFFAGIFMGLIFITVIQFIFMNRREKI